MRLFAAAILACFVSSSVVAQDKSRDGVLVTSLTKDDMRYIVESASYVVDGDLDTGIGVVGNDNQGLSFGVQGQACSDAGKCAGVTFFVFFSSGGTAEYANKVNARWAAIKATALDDGQLMLSRYVILDHGQTLENLRLNLLTTRGIAATVGSELGGQDGSGIAQTRVEIEWGDDTGGYANDGACDDARFKADGDQWTFQREHVLRDAADCKAQYTAGEISLSLDFGDNSGRYANDGTCDDNRFSGEGRSILQTDSHVRRDAVDCVAAYRAGSINRP